jgi:hypothetical protein
VSSYSRDYRLANTNTCLECTLLTWS